MLSCVGRPERVALLGGFAMVSARRPGDLVGGRYRLDRVLGAGGMGVVWAAAHVDTGRAVALKLIKEDLDDPAAQRRFLREARAASAIRHPNVVSIVELLELDDGSPVMVMELLQGEPLGERLRRADRLGLQEAADIMLPVVSAIGTAHALGIVHRDLKPENIFLAEGPGGARVVKVLDFGIAKQTALDGDVAKSTGLTTGAVIGTPPYMSPEQVFGEKDIDHRADIWALGILLYQCLTGVLPTAGEHVGQVLKNVLSKPFEPLSSVVPEVPADLSRIVERMLQRNRGSRPSDLRDVEAVLRRYASTEAPSFGTAARAPVPPDAEVEHDAEDAFADPAPRLALPTADTAKVSPFADTLAERVVPPRPPAPRPKAAAGLVAAIAIGVLAAGAVSYRLASALKPAPSSSARAARPPVGSPRRLTGAPGWEAEPAVSPDGKLVAFVSDEKGAADLWVVDARGGDPRRLTGDGGEDHAPAWFPDGEAIAFASRRGGQEGVWKVSKQGGVATPLLMNATDPAISPDGTRLAFARASARGRYTIWVAPLADLGGARELTTDRDEHGFSTNRRPAWSPDGATIAYQDFTNLWVIPAAGGQPRRITEGNAGNGWPFFSPDGRHLYYSSMREDTLALWRIPAAGGEPVRITFGTGPESQPRISRDGTRLAYSTYMTERTLILTDLATGAQARMADVEDFALAPDGRAVTFESDRRGNDLYMQSIDGRVLAGEPRRVASLPGTHARPAYSPDGKWIAIQRVVDGQRDVWILPSAGGPAQQLTNDPATDVHPAWSPDGATIAFISTRSGRPQVWVAPVAAGRPAGEARQITTDEAAKVLPSWSADGKEIAYTADTPGGGSDVFVVSVQGGAPRRLTSGADAQCARWDRRSGDIYASGKWGGRFFNLRRISPRTGEVKPLDPEIGFGNTAGGLFEISIDGSTLGVLREETRGDIWVLDAEAGSTY
jgi:serine/threonine-protein kinase